MFELIRRIQADDIPRQAECSPRRWASARCVALVKNYYRQHPIEAPLFPLVVSAAVCRGAEDRGSQQTIDSICTATRTAIDNIIRNETGRLVRADNRAARLQFHAAMQSWLSLFPSGGSPSLRAVITSIAKTNSPELFCAFIALAMSSPGGFREAVAQAGEAAGAPVVFIAARAGKPQTLARVATFAAPDDFEFRDSETGESALLAWAATFAAPDDFEFRDSDPVRFAAARRCWSQALEAVLSRTQRGPAWRNSRGETLFHYACRYADVETVRFVLQATGGSAEPFSETPTNSACRCPAWAYALLNLDGERSAAVFSFLTEKLQLRRSEIAAGVMPLLEEFRAQWVEQGMYSHRNYGDDEELWDAFAKNLCKPLKDEVIAPEAFAGTELAVVLYEFRAWAWDNKQPMVYDAPDALEWYFVYAGYVVAGTALPLDDRRWKLDIPLYRVPGRLLDTSTAEGVDEEDFNEEEEGEPLYGAMAGASLRRLCDESEEDDRRRAARAAFDAALRERLASGSA